MQSNRISGSFRDPGGYVIQANNRVFRAVDADFDTLWRELESSGLAASLMQERLIVRTSRVTDEDLLARLRGENPGFAAFLEHERLAHISYPYEWTVSMLADAGELTLKLQRRLLKAGYSLKDATAYNIQFVQGRPVFIDVASIERPGRRDVWFALGQFNRMFLFPLLLRRYRGWDFRSYFLSSLDGRTVQQVGESFGRLSRWRPGLWLDLALPLLLEGKAAKKGDFKDFNWEHAGRIKDSKPDSQLFHLQRLQKKIRSLGAAYKTKGVWSEYTQACTYDAQAEAAKKELVGNFIKDVESRRVLDVGCNTGDYSFVAAEAGAEVVAVDGDHDAVENLHRHLRATPKAITPLVVDIANPSPAIGYLNCERPAFLERFGFDCVLALALMHHLLVSANLSLEAMRKLFGALTEKHLVLEFVPTNDPMFQKLIQFRVNLFSDLTPETCLAVFGETFELLRQTPIPGSPRTLLFFRKK